MDRALLRSRRSRRAESGDRPIALDGSECELPGTYMVGREHLQEADLPVTTLSQAWSGGRSLASRHIQVHAIARVDWYVKDLL